MPPVFLDSLGKMQFLAPIFLAKSLRWPHGQKGLLFIHRKRMQPLDQSTTPASGRVTVAKLWNNSSSPLLSRYYCDEPITNVAWWDAITWNLPHNPAKCPEPGIKGSLRSISPALPLWMEFFILWSGAPSTALNFPHCSFKAVCLALVFSETCLRGCASCGSAAHWSNVRVTCGS